MALGLCLNTILQERDRNRKKEVSRTHKIVLPIESCDCEGDEEFKKEVKEMIDGVLGLIGEVRFR
jgi:hypothetical protein